MRKPGLRSEGLLLKHCCVSDAREQQSATLRHFARQTQHKDPQFVAFSGTPDAVSQIPHAPAHIQLIRGSGRRTGQGAPVHLCPRRHSERNAL